MDSYQRFLHKHPDGRHAEDAEQWVGEIIEARKQPYIARIRAGDSRSYDQFRERWGTDERIGQLTEEFKGVWLSRIERGDDDTHAEFTLRFPDDPRGARARKKWHDALVRNSFDLKARVSRDPQSIIVGPVSITLNLGLASLRSSGVALSPVKVNSDGIEIRPPRPGRSFLIVEASVRPDRSISLDWSRDMYIIDDDGTRFGCYTRFVYGWATCKGERTFERDGADEIATLFDIPTHILSSGRLVILDVEFELESLLELSGSLIPSGTGP